jgi:hypothetical protein
MVAMDQDSHRLNYPEGTETDKLDSVTSLEILAVLIYCPGTDKTTLFEGMELYSAKQSFKQAQAILYRDKIKKPLL